MKNKDTKLTAEQMVEYLYRPTTNISGVAKVLGIQKHTLYNGIARWKKTGEFPDAKWVSEMSDVILDALRMPEPSKKP